MGILNLFRRVHRPHWFVCYNCMNQNSHVVEEAIFFYDGPPEMDKGRAWFRCPRCQDLNTRSFQQLADEKSEAQLFGLEQIVKKNPRERFAVKPHPAPVAR